MEEQDRLNIQVGTIEPDKSNLEPKDIRVEDVEIKEVKPGMEKVILVSKHPDADLPIEISSAQYVKDQKISITGLWWKVDKEENIQKGSALALTLDHYGCKILKDLIGRDLKTVLDGKYLCIKAY